MNWTTRINNIVKAAFPFKSGCMHERQMILRLRIERTDKIKRLLTGKPVEEQDELLREMEEKYKAS